MDRNRSPHHMPRRVELCEQVLDSTGTAGLDPSCPVGWW
jgi:hypothetical protein